MRKSKLDRILDKEVWVLIGLEVFHTFEILAENIDECLELHWLLIVIFSYRLLGIYQFNGFSYKHLQ